MVGYAVDMSELILDRDTRLRLQARAHRLNPVVLLGAAGLSDAVLKEIDRALAAHELIKVRVPGDDRAEREAIFARIAQTLGAARVQMIGKLLVLYRPRPPEAKPKPPRRPAAALPEAVRKAGREEIRRSAPAQAPRRDATAAKRGATRRPARRRGARQT
ncbi:MAG: ribosome assembly RNA-binding protein YhbY [Burkholderiaceae bacterium]|nr:ribosome assembly RNA-binding protein YhbY [Burkholderiaceae bacterium]